MMEQKRLPDAEEQVMMAIWEMGTDHVTTEQILEQVQPDWTKPTLINLLIRLCSQGYVSCRKEKRLNLYAPLVKKSDYLQQEGRRFLKKLYHNSLTSMVAALYDGDALSNEDLAELKKFIEEAK